MAEPGQNLYRLEIPPIQTLISQSSKVGELATVEIASLISNQKFPAYPVESTSSGIVIDVSIPGTSSGPVMTTQTVGRPLPQTFEEARQALSLIAPTRSGKKAQVFNLGELRRIAQNLGLSSSGASKDVLANLILRKISEYYNE